MPAKRQWWALGAASLAVSGDARVLGVASRPALSRAPRACELNLQWFSFRHTFLALAASMITGLLLGDAWLEILTANGRRVLIVSTPSALFAEVPLPVMLSLVSVRCSRISAHGWRDRAKRPDLTVIAHTADHLPRCVGACSFRISGPPGNAAVRMTRPFRYSGTYWQMPNDEKSGP